ncbi:MAG TPA: sugar phosphate isomerase/epimerase family protein [Chloroflexota bacterium]|nr:sugar phosphate isomerase/epimerase family protein [Chloroflexota bacterium]
MTVSSSWRTAFTTLACPGWTIERIVAAAREYGYDAIEIRLLDGQVLDPRQDAAAIRDATARARAAGIEVCALDTSCRLALEGVSDLQRWIALAGELSVPILRVFGGETEEPEDVVNARVAARLREITAEAEAAGVVVALETHDAFSSARRVATVLSDVPSRSAGALWDSHHPYEMGESAGEVVSLLGDRLVHVHVKDARRTADGWQLVPLGEGEVPVPEMPAALREIGYRGYLAVEWEKKWHPELAEPDVALPQHRVALGRMTA